MSGTDRQAPATGRLVTPQGRLIVGVLEYVEARAGAKRYTRAADGSIQPVEGSGSSRIFDEHNPLLTADGKMQYLDDDGGTWTIDQLTFEPLPADEADDEADIAATHPGW